MPERRRPVARAPCALGALSSLRAAIAGRRRLRVHGARQRKLEAVRNHPNDRVARASVQTVIPSGMSAPDDISAIATSGFVSKSGHPFIHASVFR